jgi:Domain of unknown function (DUF4162)
VLTAGTPPGVREWNRPTEADRSPARVRAVMERRPEVREVAIHQTSVRLTVDRSLTRLVRALDEARVEVASLTLARPTLDDVFLTRSSPPPTR